MTKVDIRLHPWPDAAQDISFSISNFLQLRVAYSWPLCAKLTSSIKPEVSLHNISQRHPTRTELRPQVTRIEKSGVKILRVVRKICETTNIALWLQHTNRVLLIYCTYFCSPAGRQTYIHRSRHAQHNTPLSYRGLSNMDDN